MREFTQATDPTAFQNTWVDRLCSNVKTRASSFQKGLYYKLLSKKLYTLLKYSEALRVNGAKQGDPRFKAVAGEIDGHIKAFCQRFSLEPIQVYNKWPGLETVTKLSQEPKRPPLVIIIVGGLCTAIASLYILGVLAGIVTKGFHLIAR